MSLLTTSAVFSVVSASVSIATSAGVGSLSGGVPTARLVTTTLTILPDRPALSKDAIGAGTPRMLIYPTDALPSPLIYELNPHRWTNMGPEPLTRIDFRDRKTLGATVTQQFVSDLTDVEYKEIWVGGGADRIAMSWRFFSLLYDYYMNTPDVTQQLFIKWAPRDISTHIYEVFITSISVGGSESVDLDYLYRVSDGWVHESVTMTFRILRQVQ